MRARRPSLKKLPPIAAEMVKAERWQAVRVKGSYLGLGADPCKGSAAHAMEQIRRAESLTIDDKPAHTDKHEIY